MLNLAIVPTSPALNKSSHTISYMQCSPRNSDRPFEISSLSDIKPPSSSSKPLDSCEYGLLQLFRARAGARLIEEAGESSCAVSPLGVSYRRYSRRMVSVPITGKVITLTGPSSSSSSSSLFECLTRIVSSMLSSTSGSPSASSSDD